jgi:YD repeat-containing protein
MRRSIQHSLVLVAFVLSGAVAFGQAPVRYIYDELGRLITVIDPNGDAAAYHYDAASRSSCAC